MMDLLKPIVSNFTYHWYSRRDGHNWKKHVRAIEMSQWMSRTEITELQGQRLRSLLDYAYRNNPFYHARMNQFGVVPSDIRAPADLRALPLLTKDDIRSSKGRMFSTGFSPENTVHTRTGGSTGIPLHVYLDRDALDWKDAASWRHNNWAGWRPGDKVAAIWGDTDKPKGTKGWLRFWFLDRMIFLDTLKFTPERIRAFHALIRSYKPTAMMGHAHSVYQFARFCLANDLRIDSLQGVVTTAMTLLEHERDLIEEALQCRVFNRYGCEELSIIASESEAHSGMHVFSEGLVLEYLPTEVEGEYELIVTDLLNRAMPMIRYEIGDVVRRSEGDCPSGRGLERLARVSGRTADFLYRPDGTPVFGISILDTHVIHIPGIRQAQIVQEALDRLVVNVVTEAPYGKDSECKLRQVLALEFGREVRIDIVELTALPQTERGKYRFSICKITPPEPAA